MAHHAPNSSGQGRGGGPGPRPGGRQAGPDTAVDRAGPASDGSGAAWRTAVRATLHCLTGCAIGEVLGMVIGTALGWEDVPTTVLAVLLAFFFGYLLTLRGVLVSGLGFRAAVRVALAADTVSIAVMETVDNGVIALWPRAMDATLGEWLFWVSLGSGLALAFVVALPVNKWLIGRGRGHAVAHAHHH